MDTTPATNVPVQQPAQAPPVPQQHLQYPQQPYPQSGGMAKLIPVIVSLVVLVIGGMLVYFLFLQDNMNSISVNNQPVSESLLLDKVALGNRKGGIVVIQRKSAFTTGEYIANSGYIPPGTYLNVGIDIKPIDPKGDPNYKLPVAGEYLYAVLYGEMDGVSGLTPGDGQLKNLFGQYVIQRFQVQ